MGASAVARWRRRAANERGFTLIELLVTVSLLSVVLAAILSLSQTSQQLVPRDEEWAATLRDSRSGLAGMTRELRHTYAINSITATSIDAQVRVNGRTRRVRFDCNSTHPSVPTLKQCLRSEVVGGVSGQAKAIVPALVSASLVSEPAAPAAPNYVRITLKVPAAGAGANGHGHSIFLDDGVYLRNVNG